MFKKYIIRKTSRFFDGDGDPITFIDDMECSTKEEAEALKAKLIKENTDERIKYSIIKE